MFANDFSFILLWWLFYGATGLIAFPLTYYLFKKFPDYGYGLSKIVGLAVFSYLVFFPTATNLFPLTNGLIATVFVILASIAIYFYFAYQKLLFSALKKARPHIIVAEILFFFGLFFWAFVRTHQPDIEGLEKFMDYGFVNSFVRGDSVPAQDIWYAGEGINYYWYGHFLTAIIIRLTNIPTSIGYNLSIAAIAGLVLSGVYSLVVALISNITQAKKQLILGGTISALLVVFGGNFHTFYYVVQKSFSPEAGFSLSTGIQSYWYPDATRFIGYNPDVEDKTIHEFPLYSFVVSDLHAHLLNIPFVILFLAFVFRTILEKKLRFITILPLGFLLGIMYMTNSWDFANYLLATGFVFAVSTLSEKINPIKKFFYASFLGVSIMIIGLIVSLPFSLNFDNIAQGVAFVNARSALWQLAILWGYPAILSGIFGAILLTSKKSFQKSDYFIIGLFLTGWSLIILPEILYVKDIYIASHHRANTMFKLTYQSFVMFYLSSGYILIRTLSKLQSIKVRFFASFSFMVLFLILLLYPYIAIKTYYGNLQTYHGLDGETWLSTKHSDIYASILWLRENVKGEATILEANGDSYTEFNVISSYTGMSSVLGWFVHEWLWRGKPEVPQARADDILQMYTSEDITLTKQLLDLHKVNYVVVGELERQKFKETLNEKKWQEIGGKVFESGTTAIYQIK